MEKKTLKKAGRPRKPYEGSDARIEVKLSLPGRIPEDFIISIPSINGELIGERRNPDKFIELLKDAIRTRFPRAK